MLQGIKVIEFGEGVAAPLAAQFLGDLGAEVIKVERPSGDWGRTMGPGLIEGSYHFLSLNRNKRNISIDVKTESGLKIAQDLIKTADVLITNFRPGAMDKLHLGYEDVLKINPSIIYGRVSGYEHEGELSKLPGSDTVLQAVSGIMSHIGDSEGEYYRTAFQVIDHTAARDLLIGVLSALISRQMGRTPKGPIDISLFSTGVGLQLQQWQEYIFTGAPPKRVGNKNSVLSPAGIYEVLNGERITIAVLRDEHFVKFCKALKIDYLLEDERYKTNDLRLRNRDSLDAVIIPILKRQNKSYWLTYLKENDILVAPVNTIADIDQDELLRGCIPFYKIPTSPLLNKYHRNEVEVVGLPIRFQNEEDSLKYCPSLKGEHTTMILHELGYQDEAIQEYLSEGSILQAEVEEKIN